MSQPFTVMLIKRRENCTYEAAEELFVIRLAAETSEEARTMAKTIAARKQPIKEKDMYWQVALVFGSWISISRMEP